MVVVGVALSMSLTVWDIQPAQAQQSSAVSSSIVMPIPSQNESQGTTVALAVPALSGSPVNTPSTTCLLTVVNKNWLPGKYRITHYVTVLEWDFLVRTK